MIKLYDTVVLLEDLPEDNLIRGQVGYVIEIHNPDAFEVEFSDSKTGITYGMAVLHPDQLMLLRHAPADNRYE
jgi:hypothetical protein